ncbi:MAG: hypothetical protein KAV00_01985 [Phycisphaerae bacterium]|nr:hypothetical protein [Phycisphaerae bacterium]
MKHEDPMVAAIALSLYAYNVSPGERARKLYDHFGGDCMTLSDMTSLLNGKHAQYLATELPFPTAQVYVEHALARYAEEAGRQVSAGQECDDEQAAHTD